MLKKILAVFPVFILFAFLGLFVFSVQSDLSTLSSVSSPTSQEKAKVSQLWTGIRDELKKLKYQNMINVYGQGVQYKVKYLIESAQNKGNEPWTDLSADSQELLLKIVRNGYDALEFKSALEISRKNINDFWIHFRDKLIGKVLHPSWKFHTSIIGFSITQNLYSYHLFDLILIANKNYKKEFYSLDTADSKLVQQIIWTWLVWENKTFDDFEKKLSEYWEIIIETFWNGIKDQFQDSGITNYSSGYPVKLKEKTYDLQPLFLAAQNEDEDSQLSMPGVQTTLQALVWNEFSSQTFRTVLTQNNQKLDNFWEELKKTKYANLARLPVKININNKSYDLAKIFSTITQFNGKGSQLPLEPRTELQNLNNAGITSQQLGDVLKQMLVSLDNLWTQLKKILNQPEFSKWKDTSIKIKNKSYDLELLFAAAKEKADVKGSVLPLDTKLKLQELLNDQVTSEMVENQLLALNQAEAEKNQQAKDKQQRQDLTIGLATGGSVLVAAGLCGFLYWFFKIRK